MLTKYHLEPEFVAKGSTNSRAELEVCFVLYNHNNPSGAWGRRYKLELLEAHETQPSLEPLILNYWKLRKRERLSSIELHHSC